MSLLYEQLFLSTWLSFFSPSRWPLSIKSGLRVLEDRASSPDPPGDLKLSMATMKKGSAKFLLALTLDYGLGLDNSADECLCVKLPVLLYIRLNFTSLLDRGQNWLVHSSHMTWILASDWCVWSHECVDRTHVTLKVVRKITITYSGLVLSNTDPYSQLVFTSKRDRRSTRQIIRLLD